MLASAGPEPEPQPTLDPVAEFWARTDARFGALLSTLLELEASRDDTIAAAVLALLATKARQAQIRLWAEEAYDDQKVALSVALRDEVIAVGSVAEVPACPHFAAFTAHVSAAPGKLLKPTAKLEQVQGYLEGQVRRHSEDAAFAAAEKRARHAAEQEVAGSAAASVAQATAAAASSAAIANATNVLSLSDHRPIWAAVSFPSSASTIRLCSHNVQEMVPDGVSTYVCNMSCVCGSKGTSENDTKLAQKLGHLQPFLSAFPQRGVHGPTRIFWANLTCSRQGSPRSSSRPCSPRRCGSHER